MRDFRDAKLMAQTLREGLAAKHHKITVGESLEVIARLFGTADWNTLSAIIKNSEDPPEPSGARHTAGQLGFAPTTEEALHRALGAAVERGHEEATVEHLLLSLTRDPDAMAIMKVRQVDLAAFRSMIARSLENEGGRSGRGVNPKPSPAFQRVVQQAILDVQGSGGGSVTGAHLLAAILLDEKSAAAQMLRVRGIDRSDVVQATRPRTT